MYASLADFVLQELQDEDLAERLYVKSVFVDPRDDAFAHLVLSNLIDEGKDRHATAVRQRLAELGITVVVSGE